MHSSDVEGQPGTSREAELTADVRATVAVVDVRVQVLIVLGLGGELLAAVCACRNHAVSEVHVTQYDYWVDGQGGNYS